MKKIGRFLSDNPRYKRLQKPLEAAEICKIASQISQGQYEVISFCRGVLTIGCDSSAQAASLQEHSENIIFKINSKKGESKVKKIRFKIK